MTFTRIMLGAAAASVIGSAVLATGAQAADLVSFRPSSPTSFYSDPVGFAFDGFYAGVQGGAVLAGGGIGGTIGGLAGVNFAVGDMFYIGGEAQASAWFTGAGFAGYDVLGLARLGVSLTENTMIYAAGGGGLVGATPVYALGAGIEFGVSDSIGLRAEGLALGGWGAAPSLGKLQAGLIFHIN